MAYNANVTDDTTRRIGETIRTRRRQLGLSLKQLGELAEVDWSHLGRIERGEGSTDPDTYERIAFELGLTLQLVRRPGRRAPRHLSKDAR